VKFLLISASLTFLPMAVEANDLNEMRRTAVERIMYDLNAGAKDISMIPEVYTEDVVFIDPLLGEEGLQGYDDLSHYHHKLNDMASSFEVEIISYAIDGDRHILIWEADVCMVIKIDIGEKLGPLSKWIPALKKPMLVTMDDIHYTGTTIFEFKPGEHRVAIHRDIYNEMGMYSKMPIIGPILNVLKESSRENMLQ